MSVLTRDIDPDTITAFAQPAFYHVVLVWLDWPETAVRVHSGVGDIVWDGRTWTGIGHFGEINIPEEIEGLASQSADLRLIGAPDELDAYLDAPIRNRDAAIYFGATTKPGGNVLIGNPFEVFVGYMDALREVVEISASEMRRDVVLQVANGPSQRSYVETFHTDEDQKRRFPTDTAGRFVIFAEAEATKLTWPE